MTINIFVMPPGTNSPFDCNTLGCGLSHKTGHKAFLLEKDKERLESEIASTDPDKICFASLSYC